MLGRCWRLFGGCRHVTTVVGRLLFIIYAEGNAQNETNFFSTLLLSSRCSRLSGTREIYI